MVAEGRATQGAFRFVSFVGVGVPPPTPSWGNMLGGVLAEAFKPPWWMVVFPGAAITITILAVNLFGDALRDFLDPKLRTEAGLSRYRAGRRSPTSSPDSRRALRFDNPVQLTRGCAPPFLRSA
jgi:hypothetical protein